MKDLCDQCKRPSDGPGWPTARADYPDCWEAVSGHEAVKPAPWTPHGPPEDTVVVCRQCQTLWTINWNTYDAYLEATVMPPLSWVLLGAPAPVDQVLDVLNRIESAGPIRSRCQGIAKARVTQGNLREHVDFLLKYLGRDETQLPQAKNAFNLLETVMTTARNRVSPERNDVSSKAREELKHALETRVANHPDENIVDAANAAYVSWARKRTVQYLPLLRALDLTPLLRWLEAVPKDAWPGQIVEFRSIVREFLLRIALQDEHLTPAFTITSESRSRLSRLAAPEKWLDECVRALRGQMALATESTLDLTQQGLTISDALHQLRRITLSLHPLDASAASCLVTLRRMLGDARDGPNWSKGSSLRGALENVVDGVLLTIRDPHAYPATVQQHLLWHLKDRRVSRPRVDQ